MKFGIFLPSYEIIDPVALRDFAQGVEEIGYDHIVIPDHVIGANPATHQLVGPYDHTTPFHEPFVTMGYLSALTSRIELVTGILILPQRQATLVAKQAAQIHSLSDGRIRLGVAIGWNAAEYEALGMDFTNRGQRIEEQLDLMKLLWKDELVTYRGQWNRITDAGINPRPGEGGIPIWMGGWADPVLRRMARMADGWICYLDRRLDDKARHQINKVRAYCAEEGRDPTAFGLECWIFLNRAEALAGDRQKQGASHIRAPEEWMAEAREWIAVGATHIDCTTMYGGLRSVDEHIGLARAFLEAMKAM